MVGKFWRVGAVALVAVAIAGCGGSSSSGGTSTPGRTGGKVPPSSGTKASASGGKVDVCAVVTPADAATVLGGPAKVEPPASAELKLSSVCIYKLDTTDIAVNLLQVRVYEGPQFYGAAIYPGRTTVKVKGADKAFVSVRRVAGGTAVTYDLQFVKNGRTGAINYVATKGADDAKVVPALTAIADKVAAAV